MAKRSRSGRRAASSGASAPADELISTPETSETIVQDAPDVSGARDALPAPETIKLPATPVTQELLAAGQPTTDADAFTSGAQSGTLAAPGADVESAEEFDAGATREAAIVTPLPASPEPPSLAAPFDADATIVRERPARDMTSAASTPPSRPRFNTLAGAFNRARPTGPLDEAEAPQPEDLDYTDGIADEVDPETEWSLADQATVHLSQDELDALRPSFLETDEQPVWPPRPQEASAPGFEKRGQTPPASFEPLTPAPSADIAAPEWRAGLPPRPKPPFPLHGADLATPPGERLVAPDGRHPHPSSSNELPADYRMERFQELRRHRVAHEHGEEATDDITPVADAVRQWWRDLRPNVNRALEFQRVARESGSHPLPAYAPPTPASRLGDAFGKLAASARDVAGPAWKRIHDQMEHAAQGFIQKFEGDAARQQAPFLGPGRVAVFFRRGVTVGQAQRLLAASSARPMRLIPRKHGILAQVVPGRESEVGEKLRLHPYVDDVVYMDYDDRG